MRIRSAIRRKIFILLMTTLCFYGCATTESTKIELKPISPFAAQERYIIAVLPFHYKAEQEEYKNLSGKLADLILDELVQTGRFRVLERNRIDAVLKEIQLSQLGIIDESTANQIGKQLGAEMILVGSLTAIKPTRSRDSLGIMWQETRGFEISLQGRLINVTTGEIVAAAKATGMEAQEEKMALGAKTGIMDPEETLLNKAAETASKILVHDLSSRIAPKPL